jgi:hypothetical protein
MNDKGNRYAVAALKDRRAPISAEIVQLEGKLRHRRRLLVHVDSCLKAGLAHVRVHDLKHIWAAVARGRSEL